ncbi:MotA/TolQ/ExbB proton channel family protein [Jannaschia seohaensis]|uniref:Biopolymer transport protein ExbB n=1 Tax=Jannaschia seohaensis TaxID=475081 RepID=A0A2Y9AWZ7_9RHOB|nr:MotA/TolQ/ExbB proton channel family protein [Jannaschia seohaensis]PWJ16567.1 biopolymer transport protein ExbB [Jannaschia seohaensis]SSA48804.1 biopolymer transport protein ExbB [Jannaschia seohaensis]
MAALGSAGPVLLLLAALSVLSVAVFVARLIALRGASAGAAARADWLDAVEGGAMPGAPVGGGAPADRLLARAAALLPRRPAPEALTAELEAMGATEVAALGRGVRTLEIIGLIAPLLGLLGTVLGMIQSFRALELAEGAANASILAGGIWQALLTTAAGLIVTIPALVGAAILQSRIDRATDEMERVIGRAALAAALPRS